jgi:GDP-4-dehydro-6-deoxy-D-mannose reductase
MRVLITGITGFVGSHMAEHALAEGAEVFGASRGESTGENIEHLRGRITVIQSDLRDDASVRSLIERTRPDSVVHLAAQSAVGASWLAPANTLANNILSQVNLLEAIRPLAVPPRFLCVGSSEEYGMVYEEELPIRETNPLRPLSPYAVSKVTQDVMGYQYFKSYGLPIVRARAFSHEGPRRGDMFMTSSFAKQVAEIEAGRRKPVVRVGDLKPRRAFLDVRDVVRGYWLLLGRGEPGEVYNLCSGRRSWSIQQVLEFLIGASTVKGIAVEVDPERLRPSDVMILEGDPSKIEKATGWKAEIPFERTLSELLDYWRERVQPAAR